uniref:Uncharacterized protein n=1 Tax=Pundamilia nyererei TaxID=303518 RepID=A0A3B4F9N0_9CICH
MGRHLAQRNSERIYLVQPTTHYKLRGPAGPQGCVLSPILFSVHANNIFIQDCLCKYASNAALVGLRWESCFIRHFKLKAVHIPAAFFKKIRVVFMVSDL